MILIIMINWVGKVVMSCVDQVVHLIPFMNHFVMKVNELTNNFCYKQYIYSGIICIFFNSLIHFSQKYCVLSINITSIFLSHSQIRKMIGICNLLLTIVSILIYEQSRKLKIC